MTGTMTQLERFRATVEHQPHNELLYYAGFTPELKARVLDEWGVEGLDELAQQTGMYRPAHLHLKKPEDFEEPDFSAYYNDDEITEESYIDANGVLKVSGSMYHFTRYVSPLRNAETFEEIESYPYPHVDNFSADHLKDDVAGVHAEGRVALGSIGHMYETSWQIRGYEQFLMDMVSRKEWSEYILDRLMERNLNMATAYAEAGVDMLYTGDDVANQQSLMFAIDQWRDFMKSRWAQVYSAARSIKPDIEIWYHSDGNIESIIPELIDIGVTVLNPVQPECMDPVVIKKKYGDKLVLDGTIGTQTTMPFGTPDDVRDTVRNRKKELGRDGAFIISPTHVLEPEVPLENIHAFFEAAHA